MKDSLNTIVESCKKAGLGFTAQYAEELVNQLSSFHINGDFGPSDFHREIGILRKRFDDETASSLVIFLDQGKTDYHEFTKLLVFDEAVEVSFPDAQADIEDAGACYALNLNNACVYHLMCVLQLGLNTLARALDVSFEYANWDKVLNEIESEIKKIERGEIKPPNWREDQTFYSEAALQFRHFKDAWRNHVIHARARYSDPKTLQILNHVGEFMKHLATRLSQ